MNPGQPTIDQLRIFLAVVEEGSFNRAAKKLGRAISAISYGVSNLEAQLGLTLFDRAGSKKPVLTEAGAALLPDARAVADEVDSLLARVRSLHQGLESELAIAVDVMMPGTVLARLLQDFQSAYPTVPLRLQVEALGEIAALVLDGQATFGISGPDITGHPELARELVGSVTLIPVAAPTHQLAKRDPVAPGEAQKHLQLVLTDRSSLTEGKEFSVLGTRTWRLGDLGAKHDLLKQGIGWGNMPLDMVEEDLRNGSLVQIELPEQPEFRYGLHALWRKDTPPGPAACWLLDTLKERCAGD